VTTGGTIAVHRPTDAARHPSVVFFLRAIHKRWHRRAAIGILFGAHAQMSAISHPAAMAENG
jgi:hypothetical protein